jgi:hypothetical protein
MPSKALRSLAMRNEGGPFAYCVQLHSEVSEDLRNIVSSLIVLGCIEKS